MKTNLRVVALFACLILTACTKETIIAPEPDSPEVAIARSAIYKATESFISGNWHITYYVKANTNKTEAFKSYDFKFLPNGTVIAARDGQNLVGKWVITYIDNLTRLSCDFSYPASFIEMSGDWTIMEAKEYKMKMCDIIRSADPLTFEKK